MNDLALTAWDSAVTREQRAGAAAISDEERLAHCSALMFRVAFSVLRHREDAEDVVQEALVRAWRKRNALREAGRLRSWLVRICWRLALDHRRAAGRRRRREEVVEAPALRIDAEEAASEREFRARLWAAIDRLPEKLRKVLLLASIEGHTVAEVAGLLRLPEGTVKSRLYLARKRLLEELR
jgi:RNA polymerase sigma-70 factor, ECF subfamily